MLVGTALGVTSRRGDCRYTFLCRYSWSKVQVLPLLAEDIWYKEQQTEGKMSAAEIESLVRNAARETEVPRSPVVHLLIPVSCFGLFF